MPMYQCASSQATSVQQSIQQMQPIYDHATAAATTGVAKTGYAAPVAACQYVAPPIEACERIPQRRREIIHVQGPPGKVRQVVKRLPVPPPDIIERIMIVQPQQDIINVIVERPPTPPPQIIEKRFVEKQPPPIVNHHLVRLPTCPAPSAPSCALPSLPAPSIAQISTLANSTSIGTPVSTHAATSVVSAAIQAQSCPLDKPVSAQVAVQQGYQYQQYAVPHTSAASCGLQNQQAQAQYYYPNQYNGCNACYKQY